MFVNLVFHFLLLIVSACGTKRILNALYTVHRQYFAELESRASVLSFVVSALLSS